MAQWFVTEVAKAVTYGLDEFRNEIIRISKDAGQEATGKTYKRIKWRVNSFDDKLEGYIEAPNYFDTLQRGRGPGKVPANMPQIITDWAMAKGLRFENAAALARFARATAWKIRKEGSRRYRTRDYLDLTQTPMEHFNERVTEAVNVAFYEMTEDLLL